MTGVPAEPADFRLDPARAALVVIDMQRDFLLPGGFGEAIGRTPDQLAHAAAAIGPTRRVLDRARALGMLVVHTREGHRPDLSDLLPAKRRRGRPGRGIGDPSPMGRMLVRGEHGHDFVDELTPDEGEPIIDKPGKGAFFATGLDTILRACDVTQLVVTGVTTEVCVATTVREANDRGYECLVLSDCTGSYYPADHAAELSIIKGQGALFGWVATSADLLKALES